MYVFNLSQLRSISTTQPHNHHNDPNSVNFSNFVFHFINKLWPILSPQAKRIVSEDFFIEIGNLMKGQILS